LNKAGHVEFIKKHRRDPALAALTGVFFVALFKYGLFSQPKELILAVIKKEG
jgi:hypothetical protein